MSGRDTRNSNTTLFTFQRMLYSPAKQRLSVNGRAPYTKKTQYIHTCLSEFMNVFVTKRQFQFSIIIFSVHMFIFRNRNKINKYINKSSNLFAKNNVKTVLDTNAIGRIHLHPIILHCPKRFQRRTTQNMIRKCCCFYHNGAFRIKI